MVEKKQVMMLLDDVIKRKEKRSSKEELTPNILPLLIKELQTIDLDNITPRKALDILYRWKEMCSEEK